MLFVSRKETLNTETLPDTSLHNVRKSSYEANCSHSSSSCSSFVPLSKAPLPRLTKEQFDLHREFLRLGAALMAENADLFHQALTLLSAKHNLKVATPATCISDVLPPRNPHRGQGENSGCTSGKVGECDDFVVPRASFRKYVLPPEFAEKEFYQCMVCKERRAANSFGASHTHDGAARPNIRWHCPICDSFLAVTHRGYHIKNRHSDIFTTSQSQQVEEQKKPTQTVAADPASLKRARDEVDGGEDKKEETALCYTPAEKVRLVLCDESPCASSALSVDSSSSHEENPDDYCQLLSSSFPSDQSLDFPNPIFVRTDEESFPRPNLFSLPSEENLLVGAPSSPFTF